MFWGRLRAIFRWLAPVFPRSTVYFLSHSPILKPNSGDFSISRHSFQPRTSIFPRFVQYFPILRTLLREISPFIIATLLFSHSVKAFPIRVFPFSPSSTFLFSIDFLSAPHSPHPLHYSPTFFLFPPHFFNTFPNKRTNTRTLAHYARTRTLAHPRTSRGFRLLPSPLHHPSQSTVHQLVRGEEKQEKAFTKHSTNSQSIY